MGRQVEIEDKQMLMHAEGWVENSLTKKSKGEREYWYGFFEKPSGWNMEFFQEVACVAQQLYAEKLGLTK